MGQALSRVPPEVLEEIFINLQTPPHTERLFVDGWEHYMNHWVNRPSSPPLPALCLVSKEVNRIVTPLLYRQLELDLVHTEQITRLQRTLALYPERARSVWKMQIRDSRGFGTWGRQDRGAVAEAAQERDIERLSAVLGSMTGMRHLSLVRLWDELLHFSRNSDFLVRGVFKLLSSVTGHPSLTRLDLINLGAQGCNLQVTPSLQHPPPILTNITYFHLESTTLPTFFTAPEFFPALRTLRYDPCGHEPGQYERLWPLVSKMILVGACTEQVNLSQLPNLEQLQIIATSRRALPLLSNAIEHPLDRFDSPSLASVEIDLWWDVEPADEQEALEQIREIVYFEGGFRKLIVRLAVKDSETDRVALLAAARRTWTKEGTQLELQDITKHWK